MDVTIPSVLSSLRTVGGQNAGVVVLPAVLTQLVPLDLGLLVPGQVIFASAEFLGTKGATAGAVVGVIGPNGGTATIEWQFNLSNANYSIWAGAAAVMAMSGFAMGIVTVGGTGLVDLSGQSIGSNFTVNAGSAQFRCIIIER